jgi:hydrogenase maturation protease
MTPETRVAPVLIACCGHPDAGDDALGPLVARALVGQPCRAEVEVLDLGTDPMALIGELQGRHALFVVDAVRGPGSVPGRLVDAEWRSLRASGALSLASRAASTHGHGIAEALALADSMELLPVEVRIVGLAIAGAGMGDAMVAGVRAGLPSLLRRLNRRASVAAARLRGAGRGRLPTQGRP